VCYGAENSYCHRRLAIGSSNEFTRLERSVCSQSILQWSTYDSLDHSLTLTHPHSVLSSSYTFRKCLIRKHFLASSVRAYVAKHPSSSLASAVPRSWEIEITFADELDEMWVDELYDLGQLLDADQGQWYILKPGMADRGMGIRLFKSREALERIYEEFEDEPVDDQANSTAVFTSQLRHFVIQEYLSNTLLLDPAEASNNSVSDPQGHKFHLRAYCVATGALTLYLCTRVLALFSGVPYADPVDDGSDLDLAPHLTNTSLQVDHGEAGVRLLDDLIGCHLLPAANLPRTLQQEEVQEIMDQMSDVLAETFKVALENPVHFQPLPNAFELFGVDFLVTCTSSSGLQVHLLELNAEPAIELTGPRLTWILEDLFKDIGKVIIEPFFDHSVSSDPWGVGEVRDSLRKCLEVEVRGKGGW